MSGAALITGVIGSIITMAFHPTAHNLMPPDQFAHGARISIATHALALLVMPVFFLGALGLSRRLMSPNRLALAALVFYGFGVTAVLSAAVFGGIVSPDLIHQMITAPASMRDIWNAAIHFDGALNQAFAMMFVVATSIAILLWSTAILRSNSFARALGIYGCIFAPLTILAVLSGHIRLNVHGFGAIILGQAIWFFSAGVQLWRDKNITLPIAA